MAGRKPIVWGEQQREQFCKLCAIMCTHLEAASIMGIDKKTLDRLIAENFPDTPTWAEAFEYYSSTARASLRRKQFELALDGDKTMLIWLGKQYLDQSEPYKKTDYRDKGGDKTQDPKPDLKVLRSKFGKQAAVNE